MKYLRLRYLSVTLELLHGVYPHTMKFTRIIIHQVKNITVSNLVKVLSNLRVSERIKSEQVIIF